MTEEPDGGGATRSARGVRPLLAGAAVLLVLAAGFGIGRLTADDEGGTVTTTTTVAAEGGKGDGFTRTNQDADYDAEDVVAVFPPEIVRDGEISDQPKNSPGRALLEWWQAYQFSDAVTVEGLTSPGTVNAIGEDKLRALLALPGPGLQGIEVLEATEDGDTAEVQAGLLTFQAEDSDEPKPTEPTNSTPETFSMERKGDQWLFADTEFLETKLGTLPE